ncbi:MAG: DUF5050 domain-containing protein [Eubacteriales bacterium]|nr:DUF5050 domain-containing protein [Eubacteriales bacterium]
MDSRRFLLPKEKRILGGIEYKIERLVGCGASTIVYEASYMDTLNKDFAHRVLLKELYPYDEDSAIFRDEEGFLSWEPTKNKRMEDHKYFFRKGNEMNIRLLEKNPKSISGNQNSYEAYGTYYSVLPLHGGVSLEEHINEKKIYSLKEAAVLLSQILDALHIFHENGLLNLDISPDNILLLDDRAMFIDYNSVWDLNDSESDCFFSQKEGYTAPEILLQEFDEIGFPSDLYSVTAVFYQMIFGEKFSLKNRGWEKIPFRITENSEENQTDKFSVKFQEELAYLLKKGLHPLSDKRFQNIEEYQSKINELLLKIEENEKDDRPLKVKSFAWGMAGLLMILFAIMGSRYLLTEKPWLARIISQGNTNANLYNKARFCLAEEQYEYYIDKNGNLLSTSYDPEDHSFVPSQAEMVFGQDDAMEGDGVDFLNLGTDSEGHANKLYFCYYGGKNHSDSIMSMDLDGSGQEILFRHAKNEIGDNYSYAHLSDGREYIYYMVGKETEDGLADDYAIWRFDIQKKIKECMIHSSVQWFNLYGKYIYYIEYDYEKESYHLMRASLDGGNQKLLDNKNEFFGGFIQDDHMYLERFLENEYSIHACDLEGNLLYEQQGIYGLELSDVEIGYDDGWLYYSKEGDKELRKVRLDGSADKLVHEGMDCYGINCAGNYLFLSTSEEKKGEFLSNDQITEDYIIERNGEIVLQVK